MGLSIFSINTRKEKRYMLCPYCKVDFGSVKNHVYKCDKTTKNKNERKIDLLKINYEGSLLLNKKILYEEYVTNQMSLPKLKEKYKISFRAICNLLKYFNIPIRTISQGVFMANPQTKIDFIKKYGVDNPSKLLGVKEKKRQTFIKHYGVDNIWKSKEFSDNIDVYFTKKYNMTKSEYASYVYKNKSTEFKLNNASRLKNMAIKFWADISEEDYKNRMDNLSLKVKSYWFNMPQEDKKILGEKISIGVKSNWDNKTDSERFNCLKHLFYNIYDKTKPGSKLELMVIEGLQGFNMRFEVQYNIGRYFYDICIDNYLIIEVQGDYWHANPEIYAHDDIIKYPKSKKILASEIWEKDLKKKKEAENNGYLVLYVWESEIMALDSNDEVATLLFNKIDNKLNE